MIANEENIKKSIASLEAKTARGSTNISAALDKAIQLIKADIVSLNVLHSMSSSVEENCNFFMSQIILLTDGEPNSGITNTTEIIKRVQELNDLSKIDAYQRKISVFAFGVGKDSNDSDWIRDLNHSFLKLLALHNNGMYKRIKQKDVDSTLGDLYSVLSKPRFSNIQIEYDQNVQNLTKTSFHSLYAGNDLIVCGQLPMEHNDEQKLNATITAVTGNKVNKITKPVEITKKLEMELDGNDNVKHIERIWAYLRLQQMAEQKLIGQADDEKEESAAPLALALEHKFVTPWTSMICVKKKDLTESVDG